VGDVGGLTIAAHQGPSSKVIQRFLSGLGRKLVLPLGLDNTRRDGVDSARGQLGSERFHSDLERAIHRGQVSGARQGRLGGAGGHQRDGSVCRERGQRKCHGMEVSHGLTGEGSEKIGLNQLFDGTSAAAPGDRETRRLPRRPRQPRPAARPPNRGVGTVSRAPREARSLAVSNPIPVLAPTTATWRSLISAVVICGPPFRDGSFSISLFMG
jgi:hypothetical protein